MRTALKRMDLGVSELDHISEGREAGHENARMRYIALLQF